MKNKLKIYCTLFFITSFSGAQPVNAHVIITDVAYALHGSVYIFITTKRSKANYSQTVVISNRNEIIASSKMHKLS